MVRLLLFVGLLFAQTLRPIQPPSIFYINTFFDDPAIIVTGMFVQINEDTVQLNRDGIFPPAFGNANGSWSPDCTQLAFTGTTNPHDFLDVAGGDVSAYLYDVKSGQTRLLLAQGGINDVTWSPQGDIIALNLWASPELYIVTTGGEILQHYDFPGSYAGSGMRWTPDGRYIYLPVQEAGAPLTQINIESGDIRAIGSGFEFALSNDDVVYITEKDGLSSFNLSPHDKSEDTRRLFSGTKNYENLTLSPNGHWLTYRIDQDAGFYLYSLDDDSTRHLFSSTSATVYGWQDNATINLGTFDNEHKIDLFYQLAAETGSFTLVGELPYTSATIGIEHPCFHS